MSRPIIEGDVKCEPITVANRLKMATVHSILTLRSRGWSYRRIARELGVHRETVKRYVGQGVHGYAVLPTRQRVKRRPSALLRFPANFENLIALSSFHAESDLLNVHNTAQDGDFRYGFHSPSFCRPFVERVMLDAQERLASSFGRIIECAARVDRAEFDPLATARKERFG